ncbi:hypothetical protein CU097_014538 [Rhizopus azygosporus]|uniref:Uncharacterized protein n=1 Tax=Rhizopus azygosporus TaxID=86630 RepID=A0A367K645_RHIAZ|nr:hypothetical protein CU097_014538 [Rhizopus azygosporus]
MLFYGNSRTDFASSKRKEQICDKSKKKVSLSVSRYIHPIGSIWRLSRTWESYEDKHQCPTLTYPSMISLTLPSQSLAPLIALLI